LLLRKLLCTCRHPLRLPPGFPLSLCLLFTVRLLRPLATTVFARSLSTFSTRCSFILVTRVNLTIVALAFPPSTTASFLRGSTVIDHPNLCGLLHLLLVLVPRPILGLQLLPLLLLQVPLHLELLLPEALPGLLLSSLLLSLLLVDCLRPSNMVLSLTQQVLTLTSLYSRPAKVILLLVSFNGQVLEVLVADAQLVDSLQHLRQGALLVPQQLAGQLLQDQRNVVQDHRIMRRNSART